MTDVLPATPTFDGDQILDRVVSFIESYEEEFAIEWLRLAADEGGPLAPLITDFIQGDISVEELYSQAQAMQWDIEELNELLQDAFWGGGSATATGAGLPRPELSVDWGESNPWVRDSFDEISTRLVAATQATNDGVATVVAQGVRDAWSPEDIAAEVYKRVGLLPSHVVAVDKFRAQLISSGASGFQITKQVEAYSRRLRQYRAKMIGRTEVSSAANAGQHEYWRRVKDTGLLPPRTMRVWITAYDERVCPECGPLNGSEAEIGSTWLTIKGQQVMQPPAHPHCRCTTGLVFHDEFGKADPFPFVDLSKLEITKHADHDQKTHGNWATGVGRLNVATPGSGKRGNYDPAAEYRSDHASAARRDPKWEAKLLTKVQELSGFSDVTSLDEAVALMEHNVEQSFLKGIADPASEQWRSWYPIGNDKGASWAAESGVHPDIAYGIIARLSPQADWDANMVMAEQVMSILGRDPVLTDDMAAAAIVVRNDINGGRKKPLSESELPAITVGKRLSELSPEAAAHVVRSISEDAGTTLPDGSGFRWQSEYNLARSVEMFRAGKAESYTQVDGLLGKDMKIRSFYNNLRDPFDADFGEITVDTHAAGIAIGVPVTTSSREITTSVDRKALMSYDGTRGRQSALNILGSPSSLSAGVKGAYPLIADAYRNVADRHGVLPREVQSVTWEQHRQDWPARARRGWVIDVTRGIHHELGHGPEADAAIEEFRVQLPGIAPGGSGVDKPESITGGASRWANQYGQGYVWGEDERED